MNFIGIDIGSTSSKAVVIDSSRNILWKSVRPTGWSSIDTASDIENALREAGFSPDENHCISTGYGRASVPFAQQRVTEITCHAKGAALIFNDKDFTVIDIGGQDTKIISVESGLVKDFIMNDKCSAGTGRFLEIMANTLSMTPAQLCSLAEDGSGITISSMCTVFAESEVISLIGRSEKKANIASAIVNSIVKKVVSQTKRLDCRSGKIYLTGGLCECPYIIACLSKELRQETESSPLGRFAGAAGAALCALENFNKHSSL